MVVIAEVLELDIPEFQTKSDYLIAIIKQINLSGPQFPHCKNRDNKIDLCTL